MDKSDLEIAENMLRQYGADARLLAWSYAERHADAHQKVAFERWSRISDLIAGMSPAGCQDAEFGHGRVSA